MNQRILVMDDSSTFAMYLGLLLRRFGLVACPARSIGEAKELVCTQNIGVAVVGDRVEGGDPDLAIVRLKELLGGHQIAAVVVSKDNSEAARARSSLVGGAIHLPKPVDPRAFHDAIFSLLKFPSGQRRCLRCEVSLVADLAVGNNPSSATQLFSLSRGGTMFRCHNPRGQGTRVRMSLPLPGSGQDVLDVEGVVVYARQERGSGDYYCGVKFENLSPGGEQRIEDYLESSLGQDSAKELPTGTD